VAIVDSDPKWEFSDAWILAAVGQNRRGTDFEYRLRSADHYNHAIPTVEELSQGLGRLIASGLVSASEGRFASTAAARRVWSNSRGDVYTRVVTLLEAMQREPLTEGAWPVSQSSITDALEDSNSRRVSWFKRPPK